MRLTTVVELHRSNELRSNLVEHVGSKFIKFLESKQFLKFDTIQSPELSLVDPRRYPCFRPEGFDPYPHTQFYKLDLIHMGCPGSTTLV